MFKKGDYIVTLDVGTFHTDCARNNYCFKQREDNVSIHPEVDLKGSIRNGNYSLAFDKSNNLKDWRYATPQEIAKYNELDFPFDVTTVNYDPSYEIY